MRIAVLCYPGMTALDAIGPYEVLRFMPATSIRFVWHDVGPIVTDSGSLPLVGSICGTERARILQLDIEYDPAPPFDMPRPTETSASIRRAALADQVRLGLSSGMAPRIARSVPLLSWRRAMRRVRRGTTAKPEPAVHDLSRSTSESPLQVLHPPIAAGLVDHVSYRLWWHKQRSVSQMIRLAYTGADARFVIRAAHEHVKGRDNLGRRYHALHPEVFHFQHATYVETLFTAVDMFIRPMSADEHERLYAECCAARAHLAPRAVRCLPVAR
ncbi:oxygenase MpaB family protein [Nocardia ignorata]|uniref:oxygenase MpaB family protein n=1 Tax=Nocardia ignorata TaxID=145285 RepID=UPI00363C3A4E